MKIELVSDSISSFAADVLAIACFSDEELLQGALAEVDEWLGGTISGLIQHGNLTGKFLETTEIYPGASLAAKRIVIVGLGKANQFKAQKLRDVVGTVVRAAGKAKAASVAFYMDEDKHVHLGEHQAAHFFAEGAYLAAYHFGGYAKDREELPVVDSIFWLVDDVTEELREGLACGQAYAEGTNLARELVNTPGNLLTPSVFAEHAVALANRYDLVYEILEKEDMVRLGMGGLLAVNKGSDEPPKLIVLKYQGREDWDEVLGFVGKGITFDSGGISIKPATDMDLMKTDMGGGAAVLCAMEAIARLKPKVNIVAVVPTTENLLSGSAYKPGDVITTLSGKTIEVLNTDAEGRIVLADGIEYAKQQGATRIVDLATLTGACVVALGHVTSGVMGNDEDFLDEFLKSAKKAGEKAWELPMFEEYKEQIKSDIADLKNIGGSPAGTITAALFLGAFAEDVP
ncbi:MAG: hypothetical protein A2201_07755, partial [Alicyclobacillus sp. RIFOXYA1_FULL_53_8]